MTTNRLAKIAYFVIVLLISLNNGFGQSLELQWAHLFGPNDTTFIYNSCYDEASNSYVTGHFYHSVDFDPGSGTYNLTSSGNNDAFVAKFNPAGELTWIKQFGSTSWDGGIEIALGPDKSIYVSGQFNGTVDFDPGLGVHNMTSSSTGSEFLLKLDSNANFVWSVRWEGPGSFYAFDLEVSENSDVYITGYFVGTIDFDPSLDSFMISATQADAFILKINHLGEFAWVSQVSSSIQERISDLAVKGGFLYAAGHFGDSSTITTPNNTVSNLTTVGGAGTVNALLLKMDTAGTLIWYKTVGNALNCGYEQVLVTSDNSIIVSGGLALTMDVDPGVGTHFLTAPYASNYYILKLDSNGEFVDVRMIMGYKTTTNRMSQWQDGSIQVFGKYEQWIDLDTDTTQNLFESSLYGGIDIFTIKLSENFGFEWGEVLHTTQQAYSYSDLSGNVTNDGSVFIGGYINDTIDVDPKAATLFFTSIWSSAYHLKLSTCFTRDSIEMIGCDSIVSPSGNFTWLQSGSYQDTILNSSGCDSILTIAATILYSSHDTLDTTVCDGYLSPAGKYLTKTDVYQDTIPNAVGCDSFITIYLLVAKVDTQITEQISCDSFYWEVTDSVYFEGGHYESSFVSIHGCDSTHSLILNVYKSDTTEIKEQSCGPYYWKVLDSTLYTSGIYLSKLKSTHGCDSILRLHLSVDTLPDSTISINGNSLKSNASNAEYQWFICGNIWFELKGDTNQVYTAVANGEYAVEIKSNGCSVRSKCATVTTIGLDESYSEHPVSIYPNPTNGDVIISFDTIQYSAHVIVRSATGQLTQMIAHEFTDRVEFSLDGSPGVYLIEIYNHFGSIKTIRVVRQ